MKLKQIKRFSMLIFALIFSTALFSESFELDSSMLLAQHSKKPKKKNKNQTRNPNTWKPYFQNTKLTEPISSFFQQTAGIGFLYFSGIKGNLNPTANGAGATLPKSDRKLTGHIGYNRTPVMESIIGRDIWYWLKIALSYTHQGGVVFQTQPQLSSVTANAPDLTAHVRLDAALVRAYFMSPVTMVWKNYYYNPYFSIGVGPGWITLCDIRSDQFTNALRMKVSPNCVFTVDLGMKLRRAMPTYVMSFTLGCKYTEWGQILNIGKTSQQYASSAVNGVRQALSNPLRASVLYQFAPYLGVQFNF